MDNEQNDPPKARVEIPPEPYRFPQEIENKRLDALIPPPAEMSSVAHYMKLPGDIPEDVYDRILDRLEDRVSSEAHNDIRMMNRSLAEQAGLLDIAFRYHFSGGEKSKPDRDHLLMAIRAQKQCLEALQLIRKSEHNQQRDYLDAQRHQARMQDRLRKNSEHIKKDNQMAERTRRFYDELCK